MKRAAIIIAVLGISVWGFAPNGFGQTNNKPAAQNAPAGQAAGQTAGQAAAPAGKRKPMAKTQEEFAAYNAAAALTDPAHKRKLPDDFAAKFPDSELRQLLYTQVMHRYQQANNARQDDGDGSENLDLRSRMIRRRC